MLFDEDAQRTISQGRIPILHNLPRDKYFIGNLRPVEPATGENAERTPFYAELLSKLELCQALKSIYYKMKH